MNRSFKVVFNKTRGALMVVNEITSAVQKKGSKLVIAVPLALATLTAQAGIAITSTVDGESVTATNLGSVYDDKHNYLGDQFTAQHWGGLSNDLTVNKPNGSAITIQTSTDDSSTKVRSVYGLNVGSVDNALVGQEITVNLGDKGLNVTSIANNGVSRAYGIRTGAGNITFNGNIDLLAQKNSQGDEGQVSAFNNNGQPGKVTFNGNFNAKSVVKGSSVGTAVWSNALQLFGADLTFNGNTTLTSTNDIYTAQAIMLNLQDTRVNHLNFVGGDVRVAAISASGVNGLGNSGVERNYIKFHNTGVVEFTSAIIEDGIATTNAVVINGWNTECDVAETVQDFTLNVYGSGRWTGDSPAGNGTSAIQLNGDTWTINAKKFNINVISGQDYSGQANGEKFSAKFDKAVAQSMGSHYATAYGIHNYGTITVGQNTETTISVNDGFWNAVGLSNKALFNDYYVGDANNSPYDYSGTFESSVSILGNLTISAVGTGNNGSRDFANNPLFGREGDTVAVESRGNTNSRYDVYRNTTVLGSAGKTVALAAETREATDGATTSNTYGILADYSDVTVAGSTLSLTAKSATNGENMGINARNAANVTVNSDNATITATSTGAGVNYAIKADGANTVVTLAGANAALNATGQKGGAVFVGEGAVVNLNSATSISATDAFLGLGTINLGGDLNLNNSSVSKFTGIVDVNGGTVAVNEKTGYFAGNVTVSGGTLDVSGLTLASDTLKKTTLSDNGVVQAMSGQFFTKASETDGTLATSAEGKELHGLKLSGGTLTLKDARYTLDYASSASGLIGETTQVVFTGTLVDNSTTDTTENVIDVTQTPTGTQNTVHANATGVVDGDKHNLTVGSLPTGAMENQTTVVEGNLGVKDLSLKEEAERVDVNDGKRLTLVGGDATHDLIKGGKTNPQGTSELTVTIGADAQAQNDSDVGVLQLGVKGVTSGGSLDEKVVVEKTGNVTVMAGDFTLKDVDVKGTVNVQADAALTVDSLAFTDATAKGALTTTGELTLNDVTVSTGATGHIFVGNEKSKGTLNVTKTLGGAVVFLDPTWVDGVGIEGASKLVHAGKTVDGTVIVGRNSYAVFGATDDAAFLDAFGKSGLSWGADGVSAALYANGQLTVSKGLTVDGSLGALPGTLPADGAVTFADRSLLVANVEGLDKTKPVLTGTSAVSVAETSKAVLVNVKKDVEYKLHDGSTTDIWANENVTSANAMFTLNDKASKDGIYVFDQKAAATVYGDLMQATVLADKAMAGTGAAYDYANLVLTEASGDLAKPAARFDAAMNPAGALGAYATGVDRASDLRQTVRDQVGTIADSHLWVDLTGGRTKFDGLSTGGQALSLKTEHGGVVVGAETVVADTTVGAAFSAGTGSTRNHDIAGKNEFNYVGLSLYGQKAVAGLTVTADASVTSLKSEVTVGGVVDENVDQDTLVWSLGAEVSKTFAAGDVNLTPFVGADVYHLRADGYRTNHGARVADVSATAVEFPVGVRGDMTFDTTGGMTVKPGFSFAVVPTVGDREIDPTVSFAGASQSMTYTFADDVKVRGALTLDAVKDRFGVGVGLGYDWGNEERSALNLQVKARYMF